MWASRFLLLTVLLLLPVIAETAVTVEIEGLDGEALENARAYVQILRLTDDLDVSVDQVRRLHRRAPEQIREALEPLGFYDARVTESRLEGGPDEWRAVYVVDPGEPVRFTRIDLRLAGEGEADPAFADALRAAGLVIGEPAHHGHYEEARRRLLEIAARRGYFETYWIDRRLRIDAVEGTAEAILHLDTGPRYVFGSVTFDQDILADEFLRRYLRFEPGDPFERRQILDLQYALSDSGYFRTVEVSAPRREAVDRAVPIRVRTEPAPPNRYRWGIGYGTDTGARTRLGWERRRVNRLGHRFESEIELAEVRQRFGAAYTIPLADPARERLILLTNLRREDFGDGRARLVEVGGKRITMMERWQRTESLMYERSRDRIGDDARNITLVVPGLGLETRRMDDSIHPRRGYRLGAQLRGGSKEAGSDLNFSRLHLNAGWVRGLTPRTRLLTRGEMGVIGVSTFDDLPLSHRFFAGGDHSVRGFAYQSLGPVNEDGDVIGGRYLTTASVELERLIRGNWGVAVFHDAGNTANEPGMRLETAAGVGLRWRSPVGMFRVDAAQPISTDDRWRLHLSFGMDL